MRRSALLGKRAASWCACGLVAVVALTACGDSDDSAPTVPPDTVTVNSSEPVRPLVPTDTTEEGGGAVTANLFTGLVTYDPKTAAPRNAVAAGITSEDQQNWRITLNPGWTFHDGTPVTADSFIKAWNFGAYGPNRQLNRSFFAPIAGYAEVAGEAPSAEALTGLVKVSDSEFTVALSAPNSQFPVMLGYVAFAPLPEVFFRDPTAFGRAPVGNGPFKFVSWQPNSAIRLTRFDQYPGAKPKVANVTFTIYQSLDTAFEDLLANRLDILDAIPTSVETTDAVLAQLGDRTVSQAAGVIQSITFPLYDERFANADVRAAFSMAIDRAGINDAVFAGGREAATGWVSPVVDGYKPDACGTACTFNPQVAQELLARGGGFSGELTIAYNADGDHQGWVDAVCESITTTLAVPCTGTAYPDFTAFRSAVTNQEMTGLFHSGWRMDYPSIENFLVPLFTTDGSANDGGYSNAAFDAMMDTAASQPTIQGVRTFQESEALLAADMPTIPLWFGVVTAGYSENVREVTFTPFSRVDLASVELTR